MGLARMPTPHALAHGSKGSAKALSLDGSSGR